MKNPIILSSILAELLKEEQNEVVASKLGAHNNVVSGIRGGSKFPNFQQTQKLLDWGFENGHVDLSEAGAPAAPAAAKLQFEKDPQKAIDHLWSLGFRPTGYDDEDKPGDPEMVHVPEKDKQETITTPGGGLAVKTSMRFEPKLPPIKKEFQISIPVHRLMSHGTVTAILGNWKATLPQEFKDQLATIHFHPEDHHVRARNTLATIFLDSPHKEQWQLCLDSDMVPPFGNPAWFGKFAHVKSPKGFDMAAIQRLSSHGKSLVGAVYVHRDGSKRVVAHSDKDDLNKLIAHGPTDRLLEVQYVGFGCVLVHRKVYEAILESDPETRKKDEKDTYHFFDPVKDDKVNIGGEDIAFCYRANKAGHKCHLDLLVHAAHLGTQAMLP